MSFYMSGCTQSTSFIAFEIHEHSHLFRARLPNASCALSCRAFGSVPMLECAKTYGAQIFEYNGSAIVAMAGKECVAIGSDLRFGVQYQTLATDYKKVHKIHDKLFIGLSGLGTDAQNL